MIAPAVPEKIVPVVQCFEALGITRGMWKTAKGFETMAKKFNIEVVGEFPYGRGTIRMMRKAQLDEIIAKHGPKKSAPEEKEDSDVDDPQVHIGALESKIDRLNAVCAEQVQAMNLLIKQVNILTDKVTAQANTITAQASKLDSVLKQLGAS